MARFGIGFYTSSLSGLNGAHNHSRLGVSGIGLESNSGVRLAPVNVCHDLVKSYPALLVIPQVSFVLQLGKLIFVHARKTDIDLLRMLLQQ